VGPVWASRSAMPRKPTSSRSPGAHSVPAEGPFLLLCGLPVFVVLASGMRKVLILAALLMLSAGTSHGDHCRDSTDWAGFTVPCHPKARGVLRGQTYRVSPDGPYVQEAIESGCGKLAPKGWTEFDDCIREYRERRVRGFSPEPIDLWDEFGCERDDSECMSERLQEMEEKGLLRRLPAPDQQKFDAD
jgi:hypothetical protein